MVMLKIAWLKMEGMVMEGIMDIMDIMDMESLMAVTEDLILPRDGGSLLILGM